MANLKDMQPMDSAPSWADEVVWSTIDSITEEYCVPRYFPRRSDIADIRGYVPDHTRYAGRLYYRREDRGALFARTYYVESR